MTTSIANIRMPSTMRTTASTPAPTLPVMSNSPSVSIVVPALNEERNLREVLPALPADAEIILVDGGSIDGTVEITRQLRPSATIVQQTRTGKGNALACGFAASTGEIIVMLDADGSTDPAEIPRFVDAVRAGADFAKGSRFRHGGDSHDITPLRRLGNLGLNQMVNVLFGTRFTDLCYGYNAFHRSVLADLHLPSPDLPAPSRSDGPARRARLAGAIGLTRNRRANQGRHWGDGFEIETLMNIRVAAAGRRISEVPSIEAPRMHGTSNLNTFRDGMRVLRTIVHEFATRRRR